MEETIKTFPQHTCSWLKGKLTLYKNQDFWNVKEFHEGGILAQQSFEARPSDVFVCSAPKTGTVWLKALAFAIITREKYDESTSPLLTTMPHECIPLLEKDLEQIEENHKNSCFPLVATHLPYNSLPESILSSNCKIVYIYRNIKDVIVSHYHFLREANKLPLEDAPFEEAFDEFYEGVSWYGPYWDHILGYWKASLERPEIILFLKYEDMKKDPTGNVKKLAEFIGFPFTYEEEKAGVIENIIKLCSFEKLSNLEVNKSGKHRAEDVNVAENRIYFRKAKDGDWKNYLTDEMIEKIDKLIDEKLGATGLVLK
ncbi:putative quercetin-3-sulfate 4'-sulfotransferase [Helianthus annuus]|nr:putative quercetin-3-sulfate 4'-sulfotransferase [Helianthus annuus]